MADIEESVIEGPPQEPHSQRKRGRGRPKGSFNKATIDLSFMSNYGSLLTGLSNFNEFTEENTGDMENSW